jgi:hypothetical protein
MIHSSPSHRRPFEGLATSNDELNALLQGERNATFVLLTDWYHRLPDDVYAQYFKAGAFPNCVDSLLANDYGRVQCLPDYILQAGTGPGLEPATTDTLDKASMQTISTAISSMVMGMQSMQKRMIPGSSGMLMTISTNAAISRPASPTYGSISHSQVESTVIPAMTPMSGMPGTLLNLQGCTPPMMFKPGFNISSLPPENYTNTTSPLLTIPANST